MSESERRGGVWQQHGWHESEQVKKQEREQHEGWRVKWSKRGKEWK